MAMNKQERPNAALQVGNDSRSADSLTVSFMTWTEVVKLHQTNEGIGVRNGTATSLICNVGKGARYPNSIEASVVSYVVGPRTKKPGVDALLKAFETTSPVRVFTKRSTDRWVDLGEFIVVGVDPPSVSGLRVFKLEPLKVR